MTDNGRWDPLPNNTARRVAPSKPRARGEELWRLVQGEHVASCELRDDSNVGAGFEVLIRHDDEPIVGRRCVDETEARYYGNVFKDDYRRTGWNAL